MSDLARSHRSGRLRILVNGEVVDRDVRAVCDELGIDGIIRIHAKEFKTIDPTQPYLAHFNLEYSNHVIGNRYGLVSIVTPGYFTKQKEKLPVLDIDNAIVATCVDARNHLTYEDVAAASFFTYSLPHIKNILELQTVILSRYGTSLPEIAEEDLLKRTVAYTLLKLI